MSAQVPPGWIRMSNSLGHCDQALELEHYLGSIGLYTLALMHSDRQRSDGFVSARAFERAIAPGIDVGEYLSDLVRVGLIEPAEGGFRITDYLVWQRSAEQIQAASDKASRAARARHSSSKAGSTATSSANRTATSSADRQDHTDEMEETDIAVGELVNRLGECTKDHVSAMRLSGAIQETSSQHGHEVASEAVGRYIAEAKNRAIKNPVRYFEGIVQQVITEGK